MFDRFYSIFLKNSIFQKYRITPPAKTVFLFIIKWLYKYQSIVINQYLSRYDRLNWHQESYLVASRWQQYIVVENKGNVFKMRSAYCLPRVWHSHSRIPGTIAYKSVCRTSTVFRAKVTSTRVKTATLKVDRRNLLSSLNPILHLEEPNATANTYMNTMNNNTEAEENSGRSFSFLVSVLCGCKGVLRQRLLDNRLFSRIS